MKKILVLFFAVIMVFAFTACTGEYTSSVTDNSSQAIVQVSSHTIVTSEESLQNETSSKVETVVASSNVQSSNETSSKETQSVTTTPSKSQTAEEMVWVPTKGGTKYHAKSSCSNMKDPRNVTKQTAINEGFGPCSRCY